MKLRAYTKEEVEKLISAIIAEVLDENHDEMLKLLDSIPKELRAQVVNTNGVCGETPAHIAIYKDDQYMLRILLDYGAHPHAQNMTKSGDTLLHTATKLGKLPFLQMLYETHLCDMQIRNKDQLTLLDVSRLVFDPFKDLFALRLFKNYIAYYEQRHVVSGGTHHEAVDDDILLSREEYDLQQHKLWIQSKKGIGILSVGRVGGVDVTDLNSLTTSMVDDYDDDHSSSITFYDNGQMKSGNGNALDGQLSEVKAEGSMTRLEHHDMPQYSPRFEIDHKSTHGYDLDHMDDESINSGSIGSVSESEKKSIMSELERARAGEKGEGDSVKSERESKSAKSTKSNLNREMSNEDKMLYSSVHSPAPSSSQRYQSSLSINSNSNNSQEAYGSGRSNHTSQKSLVSAGSRMSQEEVEKISIIDGRKLCEEYILDRIAYDEFMRVENLKKDTNKWMRERERNRRIAAGMDHCHNSHFNSRMTYPQVEGKDTVSIENQDWFDKFRFGVQLVSRSLFVDNVVMNAVKIGALKAEETLN